MGNDMRSMQDMFNGPSNNDCEPSSLISEQAAELRRLRTTNAEQAERIKQLEEEVAVSKKNVRKSL